jgi:MFS family permease
MKKPLYFVCGHVLKSVLGTLAFIQLFRSLQSTGFWEWEQADVAFLLVYNLITGVLTGAIAMAVEHLIATNTADNQEEFMYSVFTVVSGLSLLLSDVIGAGFATRLHVTNDDYRKLPLLYGECLLVGSIFFISVILLPKSAHLVGFHRIQQQSESESESESDDGSGVFETKNKDLVECGKSIEMF